MQKLMGVFQVVNTGCRVEDHLENIKTIQHHFDLSGEIQVIINNGSGGGVAYFDGTDVYIVVTDHYIEYKLWETI